MNKLKPKKRISDLIDLRIAQVFVAVEVKMMKSKRELNHRFQGRFGIRILHFVKSANIICDKENSQGSHNGYLKKVIPRGEPWGISLTLKTTNINYADTLQQINTSISCKWFVCIKILT